MSPSKEIQWTNRQHPLQAGEGGVKRNLLEHLDGILDVIKEIIDSTTR